LETVIVISSVAIAAVLVGRRVYLEAMGKKGCSCEGKCPTREVCGKGRGNADTSSE